MVQLAMPETDGTFARSLARVRLVVLFCLLLTPVAHASFNPLAQPQPLMSAVASVNNGFTNRWSANSAEFFQTHNPATKGGIHDFIQR